MATTEIVDIVDERDNVIGSASVEEAHDQKLLHRVAGVFVFNTDGLVYLQTGNKYNKLDVSVGGHVQKGESYEKAARREMFEEIGLDVLVHPVSIFLPKNARLGHYWGLFTATAPEGWKFQATEEVFSLKEMDIDTVKLKMQTDPDSFTHGFLNAMTELVRVKKL